jgi:pilus assembly protein Flp/PilA
VVLPLSATIKKLRQR